MLAMLASPKNEIIGHDLGADIDFCMKQIDGENSAFWRRTYIRTAFSYIEAMNELLREKAYNATCVVTHRGINISRLELLSNKTYRIKKNGQLEEDELRMPFINYTAFILRSLAEESGIAVTFFGDHGWGCFQQAVAIRNRLTHPKQDEDIMVSDDDIKIMYEALRWYSNILIDVFDNSSVWTRQPQ